MNVKRRLIYKCSFCFPILLGLFLTLIGCGGGGGGVEEEVPPTTISPPFPKNVPTVAPPIPTPCVTCATYSVTDYGAVGDGDGSKAVANAIAFNNAITDINVKGGGKLIIPDGTYMLAKDTGNSVIVRLKSHVQIQCASHNAILKSNGRLATSTRMMGFADPTGASLTDVIIDGCSFDGSDTTPDDTSEQSHAIFFGAADPGSVTNVTVTNNFIKDCPGDGVQLSNNSSNIIVVGNHIRNVARAGIGAGTGGASKRGDYYIAYNQFEPAPTVGSSRGIDLETDSDLNDVLIEKNILNILEVSGSDSTTTGRWTIRDNQVYAGHLFVGGVNDVLIENNTITYKRTDMAGIQSSIRGNRLAIINNNITVMTDRPGIVIQPGSGLGGTDIFVANNVIQNKAATSTREGIDLYFDSHEATVSGNTVSGFYTGISLNTPTNSAPATSTDILVDNNSISATTYGINLYDYITGATIQYNTLSGGTADARLGGTNKYSSSIVLKGNTLVHNTLLNEHGQTYSSN